MSGSFDSDMGDKSGVMNDISGEFKGKGHMDISSSEDHLLEVLFVTIGSGTYYWVGAQPRAGLDGVNTQLRAREEEKRNHVVCP